MKNDEIKLFAFDMGHVIIDFEWQTVCEGFCKRANFNAEDFAPILKHLGSLGYETGRIGTAGFLKEINRVLDSDIDEIEFTSLWNATFRENHEMFDLLKQLKASHKLYLLSNTNESHYGYIQQQFDIASHFEELILSYQVGCAKPDAAIYQEVLKRSGITPGSCLFIDDLAENVRAAQSAGMQAIAFTSPDALKQELRKRGVLAR